jgi:hypothetical protein
MYQLEVEKYASEREARKEEDTYLDIYKSGLSNLLQSTEYDAAPHEDER